MDRLRQLEVFVAVADSGSFAGAAARLRISPPAATRAVAALEDRLGTRLLTRTTRRLSLTDAGVRFLDSARRILADLHAAEKDALGEAAEPVGHLSVTAPVTFGRMALVPAMGAFLAAHARLTASVLLVDRIVNLAEEGIDAAVRIGALPDSSLVARRIGMVRRVLVASPAYLAARGVPQTPADLKRHAIVAFSGLAANSEWRFAGRDGAARRVAVAPRLTVNDAVAAVAAAEAGEGIAAALSYQVAEPLARGALVPVLEDHATPALPVQIVHPQARLVAPKVRAFVDAMAPRLARFLARVAPPRA